MKYSNGDMDDLFRRASERYPLKTDSADWDRLVSALDGLPPAPSDKGERRRRRGFFWWFLLLPLAGIGYLTLQEGMRSSAAKDKVVELRPSAGKATGGQLKGGGGTDKVVTSVAAEGSDGPGNGVQRVGSGGGVSAGGGKADGSATRDMGVTGETKVRIMRTSKDSGSVGGGFGGTSKAGLSTYDATASGSSGVKVRSLRTPDGAGRIGGSVNGSLGSEGSLVAAAGGNRDPMLALLDLRRAPIGGGYKVMVDVVAPAVPVDSSTPAAKKQSKKSSHGYIGLSGAPDFSTVRFQTMKGIGTTFGVLLGYSFNARWAVESGLYVDRKRYYTAGEYFKKSMPAGYTLLNADGTCYMWEIPVNVRYNLSTSPRMKWFATAGLSTYLMTSEQYTYQVQNNWVRTEGYWNFHNPSRYWFSIVNLSAGFEQRVGKIGNLRLEPYVRIPLSGIGTGSLPILSAGVNIGFTRQLW